MKVGGREVTGLLVRPTRVDGLDSNPEFYVVWENFRFCKKFFSFFWFLGFEQKVTDIHPDECSGDERENKRTFDKRVKSMEGGFSQIKGSRWKSLWKRGRNLESNNHARIFIKTGEFFTLLTYPGRPRVRSRSLPVHSTKKILRERSSPFSRDLLRGGCKGLVVPVGSEGGQTRSFRGGRV